jgi:hypothetical protein
VRLPTSLSPGLQLALMVFKHNMSEPISNGPLTVFQKKDCNPEFDGVDWSGVAVEGVSLGVGVEDVSAGVGVEDVSAGVGVEDVSAGVGVEDVSLGVAVEDVSAGVGVEDVSLGVAVEAVSSGDEDTSGDVKE